MPVRFCSSQCARRSSARGCAPRGICKDARAQTSPRWRSPRTSNNSCQSASHRRGRPHQGRWCYGKTPVKPSLTRCLLRGRNCCRPRSAGYKSSSDTRQDEEPIVRSTAYFYTQSHRASGDRFLRRKAGNPGHRNDSTQFAAQTWRPRDLGAGLRVSNVMAR